MLRQNRRRYNLSLILSSLEFAGVATPQQQAVALGSIVTANKLSRMVLGSAVPSMFARGAEHALELPRGWLDAIQAGLPSIPVRLHMQREQLERIFESKETFEPQLSPQPDTA